MLSLIVLHAKGKKRHKTIPHCSQKYNFYVKHTVFPPCKAFNPNWDRDYFLILILCIRIFPHVFTQISDKSAKTSTLENAFLCAFQNYYEYLLSNYVYEQVFGKSGVATPSKTSCEYVLVSVSQSVSRCLLIKGWMCPWKKKSGYLLTTDAWKPLLLCVWLVLFTPWKYKNQETLDTSCFLKEMSIEPNSSYHHEHSASTYCMWKCWKRTACTCLVKKTFS